MIKEHCTRSRYYYVNRKKARAKQLAHYERMRAAKAAKRLANPPDREPELVRFYPLEFCVRHKGTGQVSSWHDIRSARRMAKQAALLLKYCVPETV